MLAVLVRFVVLFFGNVSLGSEPVGQNFYGASATSIPQKGRSKGDYG